MVLSNMPEINSKSPKKPISRIIVEKRRSYQTLLAPDYNGIVVNSVMFQFPISDNVN